VSNLILFCRVDKYPTIDFLVVIDPSVGGGNGTSLDESYRNALPDLTERSNVITVGYVDTNLTLRNITDVINDIESYGSLEGNLTFKGIFFDQTPITFTNDSLDYLNQIDDFVRGYNGFGGVNFVSIPLLQC